MKFRKLNAEEIDARVATVKENGVSLLLYKDARVDQNILDETVGAEFWKRDHQLIGNNLYCTVSIYVEALHEWVSKQDVGTESYTEKEKGQASDSFKRACFNWGIGRELYTAPFIWINADSVKIDTKGGKSTTYDKFSVKSIGYDDKGNINHLVIYNDSMKKVAYTMGKADGNTENVISKKEVESLKALMKRKGVNASGFNGKKLDALTAAEYTKAVKQLGAMNDASEH